MDSDETVIVSVKQYALLRGRSVYTIRRWIHDKKIIATQLAEGHEWEIEISKHEYEKYRKRLRTDQMFLFYLHFVTIVQVSVSIA